MKFMMFVVADPDHDPDDAAAAAAPGIEEWFDSISATGRHLEGDRLRPASQATTVRVRGGALRVTDGAASDATEAIVGFDILECGDLEAAIAIAAGHPMASAGRIELRPFWPLDEG